MSDSHNITLRIQSSEGTTRVEVPWDAATSSLYEAVHGALRLQSFAFALFRDRQRRDELVSAKSATLRGCGLRHGDMLFLHPVDEAPLFHHLQNNTQQNNGDNKSKEQTKNGPSVIPGLPVEDEVDQILSAMDGKIQRQRDEKLCRHNRRGCCVHCSPLEPWDEGHLREHNIKHMSFHAHLRKLSAGAAFVALQEPSCTIKPGCKEHPPWPRGICSACQPAPVTLARQPYRHVDNVVLAHAGLVERFLAFWRASAHQRIGILYGNYEVHEGVPLGVRARVQAIWEPPQSSARDSVALVGGVASVAGAGGEERAVAALLGLQPVGWIFTDLLADDVAKGTVKCTRGVDTHFLSACECVTAAHLQAAHPRACRLAAAGAYGSKFVTVCVTGDSNKQVHLEGYQVSEQCVALARDGVLVPTRDAPELGYIREPSPQRYVPDVYYTQRDAYGNDVTVSARRLPVAYLLVDVPCGVAAPASAAAAAPAPHTASTFPPAHRPLPDMLQTPRALHAHLAQAGSFLEAMSDLHVLVYLACNDTLPLSVEGVRGLCEAVRAGDARAAARWRRESTDFATLERLALEAHDAPPPAPLAPPSAAAWTCALCTFRNAARAPACEMCAMPRSDAL